MIETRELNVSVPGGSVFARIWQPPNASGIPIVLLHDSVGCVELWRDFPNILAQSLNRNIIAYDRLGFGRSTPRTDLPSNDFISQETNIIVALLDALRIEKSVLFGYSVGGSMALCAAADAPDRVAAVISESAQMCVEDRTLEGIATAQERFSNPEQLQKLCRYHGDRTEWILRAWWQVWTSPSYANWSMAPVLPKVKCPVLAIHGDRDDYGSYAFPELVARLAGGETTLLLLEHCGHMPHRERLDEVLGAVSSFLQTVS